MNAIHGGDIVGDALVREGARALFTLCGGHISPILVGAKARGVRVVDVRDEASAVFAADALARMTGTVGVAAVTAGPGVTNTITALKNAQMAESPLVLFGGATATVLRGRGALQDIDQIALVQSATKWATRVARLPDLEPTLRRAFACAREGVPGPVFVEVPVDLLYPEELVRSWYVKESGMGKGKDLASRALTAYLEAHLYKQFHGPAMPALAPAKNLHAPDVASLAAALPLATEADDEAARAVAGAIARAQRPVLVIGSQAVSGLASADPLQQAVRTLGVPTFLGGMARGLLGRQDPLQLRHHRGKALKEADLVVIAGFPFDFRLGYGQSISRKAELVSVNLDRAALRKNRRPERAIHGHPGHFLVHVAERAKATTHAHSWLASLRDRDDARDREIGEGARTDGPIDAATFAAALEKRMSDDAMLVVDGGDFVATCAYVVRPRAPLSWLDPGVFGTLGVGGGFALGAAIARPGTELWLLYGDGSSAYSLAELDTCARHGLAPIAVIGNDGSWAQIAREQIEVLGDDVGTVLRRLDYHKVAEGYGAHGILVTDARDLAGALDEAKAVARTGRPVCVNVHLAASDFRKGSISM